MRPAVTQMEQGIMPNEGLQDRDRHRRNLEIHREQQKTKGQRTGKLNHIPEFRGEGLAGSEGPSGRVWVPRGWVWCWHYEHRKLSLTVM